jgi:hypothetical protein
VSQTDRPEVASRPLATPARPVAAVGAAPADATRRDRSPAEIERDIETIRARLAGSVDELANRAHPRAVANRAADKARTTVDQAVDRARSTVIDERGRPRTSRLAAVGGVVATLAALVIWRKRR